MGKGFRVLNLVKPLLAFLPEVQPARKQVSLREKLLYTAITLLIFLVCSQLPLYGIHAATGSDPLYWMRMILASNRGTLMELGITPIVTSGMWLQLLVGSKLIKFDSSLKEDRDLLTGAQKLLGILLTLGQAVVYVLSGMYGDVRSLGAGNATLIIAQLVIAGILVISLDELMQKGYGVGSATNLFIATNICETIIWKAFSPMTMNYGHGAEFEGSVVSVFRGLISRRNTVRVLRDALFRGNLPNLTSLLATIVVFIVVVYVQGFRVMIPVRSTTGRGISQPYPIKLLYTSNMPIILQSALVSNIYFISQLLYKQFGGVFLVRLIGDWKESEYLRSGQLVPAGGLVYYITPPTSFGHIWADPLHAVLYVTFMLTACALFSKAWIQVSGSSARDVAKQLKQQNKVLPGHRDSSMEKELNRYIPTAAAFGGILIGALTIMADLMGAIGSGTGILLTVSIIYQTVETLAKEQAKEYGL
ncbi:unnamed protein product [Calypogeia fissa]